MICLVRENVDRLCWMLCSSPVSAYTWLAMATLLCDSAGV
jgi:hypothetical protein